MDIDKTTKCKCAILCSDFQKDPNLQLQSTLCHTGPVEMDQEEESSLALPPGFFGGKPWPEKVRTTNSALWALRLEKGAVRKIKNPKHRFICHCWMELALLQVVPVFLLQLRVHFWHKNVRRYERKICKTNKKKNTHVISDSVFVCVRVC